MTRQCPAPNTDLTATQKRAAHPDFVPTFSAEALRDRLPFRFPVPQEVPPSPKHHYRSHYRYLGFEDLADITILATLTAFEVALRLIDFSPVRDYLAAHYYTGSAKGQVPFDPVSLFLCICLRRELDLGWRPLDKLLAGEHGAGWRRLFGFQAGETPSEAGLRYFFNTVGQEVFDELCPLFIDLLHAAGLLPRQSTFPAIPLTAASPSAMTSCCITPVGTTDARWNNGRPLQHALRPGHRHLLPTGAASLSGPGRW